MPLNKQQYAEVEEVQAQTYSTRRVTVPALEEILFKPLPVLDHGFVRLIDYMGDDTAIVQAARVSYGRGTKKMNQDQGLIHYLMRHHHTTPFEMCEIKYHIKLPIFVARQWIRHRTANVNEYSGRYSIMGKEFYIPAPEHLAAQSTTNRQGRDGVLSPEESARVLELLRKDALQVYAHYEEMMNATEQGEILDPHRTGLSRELARMNLTLNYYTEWYWKIDLHNLLHFLSLRADHHAQYEIRAYADVIMDTVSRWVPLTMEAFKRYRLNALTLSESALHAVKRMIKGETVTQDNAGMTAREWRELCEVLDITSSSQGPLQAA